MQPSEAEEQERLDYIFQHNYYRTEQAWNRLAKKGGKFSLTITSKKGERVRSTYKTPDDDATMEFALAIANFAIPDGVFNVDRWLQFLRKIAGEKHSSKFDEIEEVLKRIRKGEGLNLTLNQERITAEKAYQTMARRAVFANDTDAAAFLSEMRKDGLVLQMMWELYHGYCIQLLQLLRFIHDYRKEHGIRPQPVKRDNICIFCKATEGVFDHVEHTMPESLGNEYSFLPRGYVCGTCKLSLDRLEDRIHEMLPFSMTLLTTRLGNKKGKLPTLKSKEMRIEKKSPNVIRITHYSKKEVTNPEPVEGGGYKFPLRVSGQLDAHKVARTLYKAALGAIALERGREYVLDERFDAVRRYITQGGTFPNKMAMSKSGQPSPLMQAQWNELEGVPVVAFVVLGWYFAIALGEKPKIYPPDEAKPEAIVYDLSLEKPEKAIEQWDAKPEKS